MSKHHIHQHITVFVRMSYKHTEKHTLSFIYVDDNQRISAFIYPYAFKVLDECPEIEIVRHTASLIGRITDNNGK